MLGKIYAYMLLGDMEHAVTKFKDGNVSENDVKRYVEAIYAGKSGIDIARYKEEEAELDDA